MQMQYALNLNTALLYFRQMSLLSFLTYFALDKESPDRPRWPSKCFGLGADFSHPRASRGVDAPCVQHALVFVPAHFQHHLLMASHCLWDTHTILVPLKQ